MNDTSSGGVPESVPNQQPSGMTAAKVVPAGQAPGDQIPPGSNPNMHPGDELPPGAPGAGENLCYACNGTGRVNEGQCPQCGGTGKVIVSVSGGP